MTDGENRRKTRRMHYAANREVRSGNVAPFASRNVLVSLWLRLFMRTSREAGLLRLGAAAILLAVSWLSVATCGYAIFVLAAVGALVVLVTTWKALLPRKAWEDPLIVGVNRLPTHSRIGNYPTFKAAEACGRSPNVVSLSGVWKFFLASGVTKTPAGFEQPEFSDESWTDIAVPGHWQLQSAGEQDPPIYTNTNYPFPNHPPYAPRTNPTGLYRRDFALPPEWFARTTEHPYNARLKGRVVLVFQGVDSAFHLWVNGVMVGFAKGSRLPCEFDVTDVLRGQLTQSLCLRVVRWSDGSYLEDQDHWWLSGVYREVELALRPAPTRISDFMARPMLREDNTGQYSDASLEVEVLLEHDIIPALTASRVPPVHSLGVRGMTAARRATVDGIGDGTGRVKRMSTSASDPCKEMEATGPLRLEEGWRQEEIIGNRGTESVTCTLVDTATGQRFPLDAIGSLSDWQMGLPPGDARRARRQRKSCVDAAPGIGSRFCRIAARNCTRGVFGSTRSTEIKQQPATTTKSTRLFLLQKLPGPVRSWSAENPQLYTLVVELRIANAAEVGDEERVGIDGFSQFESARIGFRNVLVRSGQLLVNGRAVMLAGVNRHEHDPNTGKTVSEESMRRDIITMKRFNFNAVRNCHYPNHWRWYELCDELGLYVCDEANIESHGQIPLGRLSADPAWRLSYLDRVWRMLAANKNHACIILWSLGNESGDGANLVACRRLVKEVDPSRPVAYEGGGRSLAEGCGCTDLTDVVFPMYSSVEATELLGTDGPEGVGETRPCVLCEYSHAMGNSNGNLHKYWEIFRKHRRLQGGFIWDWVDQGLTKHDPVSGRRFWADGGGFSLRHSEGYDLFCVNGLTFPDRSPHPALWEAKFLAQPVGIELLNQRSTNASTNKKGSEDPHHLTSSNKDGFYPTSLLSANALSDDEKLGLRSWSSHGGTLHATDPPVAADAATSKSMSLLITNRYDFSSLGHLSAEWWLKSAAGGDTDSALVGGSLAVGDIEAGQSYTVELDVGNKHLAKDSYGGGMVYELEEIFLQVQMRLRSDTPWAQAGHLVAWGSFQVGAGKSVSIAALDGTKSAAETAERNVGASGANAPLPALIVYDDEEESLSSREGSPMGQLKEHLLTRVPPTPTASVVVVKGMLKRREGALGLHAAAASGAHSFPGEWMLIVSRVDGSIQRFVAGGVDLIEPGTGPSLCLWRAATDNDRAGWPTLMNFVADHRLATFLSSFLPLSRLSHLARWEASGLSATDPPVFETQGVGVEKAGDECIIRVAQTCCARRRKSVLFHVTTEIRMNAGGQVEISTDVKPTPNTIHKCVSLARVGLSLKLPAGFGHVEWFGRGPFECYQDRKHGAAIDFHSGSVEEQHVPYIHPSENGGKADVRWIALRKEERGVGLLLQAEGGRPFEGVSCGLFSAAELQQARRTVDLPLRDAAKHSVFVNVDHRSMGVGGDNSWYPNIVHKEYTVPANRSYRIRARMVALAPGESAPLSALTPSSSPF